MKFEKINIVKRKVTSIKNFFAKFFRKITCLNKKIFAKNCLLFLNNSNFRTIYFNKTFNIIVLNVLKDSCEINCFDKEFSLIDYLNITTINLQLKNIDIARNISIENFLRDWNKIEDIFNWSSKYIVCFRSFSKSRTRLIVFSISKRFVTCQTRDCNFFIVLDILYCNKQNWFAC